MLNVEQLLSTTRVNHNPAFDPAVALQKYRIDLSTEIVEPSVLLRIGQAPVATLGNFSVIMGKAKNGKTFFVSCLAAAAVSGSCSIDGVAGETMGENKVLLFDTEQSEYHAHRTVRRTCRQIDGGGQSNLLAYGLRPLEPRQRWDAIEFAIRDTPGLKMVVIDGIVDLLTCGINDEPEAIKLTSALLRWTAEYNIHIIAIIHQNKADFNARGHIGSSLVNKAETVLSVTKKNDVFEVKAEYCRDRDFPPLTFAIGEDGLPYQSDPAESVQGRKKSQMGENLSFLFKRNRALSYRQLCEEYCEISGLSIPTAKRHLSEATKNLLLKKDHTGVYRLNLTFSDDENDPF